MFLLKHRIKAMSINHVLGKLNDLPMKADDERISQLVEELRIITEILELCEKLSANKIAKNINQYKRLIVDEIVKSHMRLAINIVGQYANFNPKAINDYVSEAMLAIVDACNNVQKMYNNNLTGFIVGQIHGRLANYSDDLIPTRLDKKPIVYSIYSQKLVYKKSNNLENLKELLNMSIKTRIEREVIELRSQCYVDREIADILKLSLPRIAQIRSAVEERFERLEKKYGEIY